jgi:hypothetical protein
MINVLVGVDSSHFGRGLEIWVLLIFVSIIPMDINGYEVRGKSTALAI